MKFNRWGKNPARLIENTGPSDGEKQKGKKTACIALIVFASLGICLTAALLTISQSGWLTPVEQTTLVLSDADTNTYGFSVSADRESVRGIALDCGFTLTYEKDVSAEEMKKSLKVTGTEYYSLEKQGVNQYRLTPSKLNPHQLLTVSLVSEDGQTLKTAAFQTEQEFMVSSVYPSDNAGDVSKETGIEVKFSYPDVDLKDFEEHFSISPAVKGSFEKHASTLCFVPQKPLEEGKIYKVKVSRGLGSKLGGELKEDTFFSFETYSPEFNSDIKNEIGVNGNPTETFLPEDTPLVDVWGYGANMTDYRARVFRYPDADSYIRDLKSYALPYMDYTSRYNSMIGSVPTESLTEFLTYSDVFRNIRESYNSYKLGYAVLPQSLPEGWYLVKITALVDGKEQTVQKFIQVSSLSVYTAYATNRMTFWVNDTQTGGPSANADITAEALKVTGKTGKEGILATGYATNPSEYNTPYLLSVTAGDKRFLDACMLSCYNYGYTDNIRTSYYIAAYTDRSTYMPSDTVLLWGLLLPKSGKSVPGGISKVHITLTDGSQQLTQPVEAAVKADGSYTAKVKLEDLVSGTYYLQVQADGTAITSTGIRVKRYEKPSYTLSVTTDNWFYADADLNPVTAEVQANFYDGTPAAQLAVEGRLSGNNGEIASFLLDNNGWGTLSQTYDGYMNGWEPCPSRFEVNVASTENTYCYAQSQYLTLFNRNVMLETETAWKGKKPVLTLMTNQIDLSKLTATSGWTNDLIRGKAAETEITINATRYYQVKVDKGTVYDFVTKTTLHRVDYESKSDPTITYTVKTVNGKLVFDKLPPLQGDDYYGISLLYKDSKGRDVQQGTTLCPEDYNRIQNRASSSSLISYRLEADRYTFGLDSPQPIQFRLTRDGKAVSASEGRLMTVMCNKTDMSAALQNSTSFQINPTPEMIPNVSVLGAFFDGKHTYPLSAQNLKYDITERELNITAKCDLERYQPGQTARVTLTVTRKGKPVKNTGLLVSVVDEAALAIDDNRIDLMSMIYSDFNQSIQTGSYSSYQQHDMLNAQVYGSFYLPRNPNSMEGGSEGNGTPVYTTTVGGKGGIRSNFADTAAFVALNTDENGNATAEFVLPDNLTSWRATLLGFSAAGEVGTKYVNIKVSRDYFVQPLISDRFVEGDRIVFSARSYGDKAGEQKVSYTASLTGDAKKTLKGSGSAKENVSFDFGPLPKGSYTVTITGQCGSFTDGVQKDFVVLGCGTEFLQLADFELEKGLEKLDPTRYPVTLSFYNADYLLFNQLLNQMLSAPSCRMDAQVASAFFNSQIELMAGTDESTDAMSALSNIYFGAGLSALPSGERDPVFTARVAAAMPEICKEAVYYFDGVLTNRSSTREEVCAAYMGLAALEQPVLLDLRYLAGLESLTETERLYIIAGLALIGDTESASKAYDKYMAPRLTQSENGDETLIYFDSRNDPLGGNSALCLTVAALTGKPQADGLARYLLSVNGQEDLYLCEFIQYCKNFKPASGSEASFSYTLDGVRKEVTLSNRNGFQLTLNKDQYNNLKLKKGRGNVKATTFFYGYPTTAAATDNAGLTVTKTIQADQGLKTGSTVKVILTVSADTVQPGNTYQIDDYLPTGLRYLSCEIDTSAYLTQQEGQKLSLIWVADERNSLTVTVYTKAVLPGTFILDSAYARPYDSIRYAFSPKTTLTIE